MPTLITLNLERDACVTGGGPAGCRRRRILHFERKLLRRSRRSMRVLLDSPCSDFTQHAPK